MGIHPAESAFIAERFHSVADVVQPSVIEKADREIVITALPGAFRKFQSGRRLRGFGNLNDFLRCFGMDDLRPFHRDLRLCGSGVSCGFLVHRGITIVTVKVGIVGSDRIENATVFVEDEIVQLVVEVFFGQAHRHDIAVHRSAVGKVMRRRTGILNASVLVHDILPGFGIGHLFPVSLQFGFERLFLPVIIGVAEMRHMPAAVEFGDIRNFLGTVRHGSDISAFFDISLIEPGKARNQFIPVGRAGILPVL